jgi:hypothetical protein
LSVLGMPGVRLHHRFEMRIIQTAHDAPSLCLTLGASAVDCATPLLLTPYAIRWMRWLDTRPVAEQQFVLLNATVREH